MPREEAGEDEQRGDHEPAALVERRAGDPEEDGQGSDEHAGPQQHVEAERLTLEERVAGDSEEERRRNERDRDLISIAHRRAIQP